MTIFYILDILRLKIMIKYHNRRADHYRAMIANG